jgi:Amt family ammonium transporter
VAYLKAKFRYDDSLDAFGVHGVGGCWGAVATGIFATIGGGSLITGDTKQFLVQLLGVVVSAFYAYVVTWAIFTVIDKLIGVRVNDEEELTGLDQTQHSEVGYSF